MNLIIFGRLERDICVKSILEKNNTEVLRAIINFAETEGVTNNSIREYVSVLLANDDNIISSLAQSGKKIGDELMKIAAMDIDKIYKKLFQTQIKYSPSGNDTGFCDEYIASIRSMTESQSPEELLERLIYHYRTLGSGVLSKFVAFKYNGVLQGISKLDNVSFDELIGLDYQKNILIDNTKALIKGKRANNVLLFGDRGCGKSSSVKALLNMFSKDGLRVIEIPKAHIADIPAISSALNDKPHKYILFLDDLSFEAGDTDYKALKIAMEGQLQANGDNVLIYATSNRRHLIKETWADREGGEIHRNDHMQETLSLSERFGISLVFSSLNQKEYLNIVSEILKRHNVEMNDEIKQAALVWQMDYGTKNGRCANQFVASYLAKLELLS